MRGVKCCKQGFQNICRMECSWIRRRGGIWDEVMRLDTEHELTSLLYELANERLNKNQGYGFKKTAWETAHTQ